MGETTLVHEELSYKIIGALYAVDNVLGCGLKEIVYQQALVEEFRSKSIPFEEELYSPILYNGKKIGARRFDFLVDGKVVLEIKATEHFSRHHIYQLKEYLQLSNLQLGIIANFTRKGVIFRRVVNLDP